MSLIKPFVNGTLRPFRHVDRDGQPVGRYWNSKRCLHRLAGPAVERSDGAKEWHLDGQFKGSEYGDSQSWVLDRTNFPGYGPARDGT